MNYEELYTLAAQVEERLQPIFSGFERTAEKNTKRVLDAFRAHRVSEPCFAGTTGYGYDDLGRETLEKVYADVFGAEAALVHHVCERHARDRLRALRRSPAGRHDPCRYGSAVRYAPHRHHRLRPRLARLARHPV